MRDLLALVKEMRSAPPKKSDDPRFDELEEMANSIHMEEEGEGQEDMFSGVDEGDESAALEGEEDSSGIPDDDEDARMMAEELGTEDVGPDMAGLDMGPGAEEESPEEALVGKPKPKAKRPNPLMKKSSYLA